MYHFSRAIYRELASGIDEPCGPPQAGPSNHQRVLRACESTITRMATDRHYFARPTQTLFNDIRIFFPVSHQHRVFSVVDRYVRCADEFLAAQPRQGYDIHGNPLQCRATTRKGTPCQRMPLAHNGYCPSHQHLAETENVEAIEPARDVAIAA
jgi:hypothetical protein